MTDTLDFNDRMLSLGLARVSEAAAIASADLIGRGDEKAADQAAVDAMRTQLNLLDIAGVVVIGEGEAEITEVLQKKYKSSLSVKEGVSMAVNCLKEYLQGDFSVDRVDAVIVTKNGKQHIKASDLKAYLK